MKKKLKNWLIYTAVVALMGMLRCMSLSMSRRFGRWLGRRAFGIAKSERAKTISNLQAAFVDESLDRIERLGRSIFEHFGAAAAECVNVRKIHNMPAFMELTPESRKVLDDTLAQGKGVVFVSGHCGNWELMARSLAGLGYPINTIGKKSYDPRFTRMMERFREEGAVRTIWRGSDDVMQRMKVVLRRGEIMGLLIDQDTRVAGVFVPFFGRPAFTPNAAAYLAKMSGAPIVCGFNHRNGPNGYKIVIESFEPSTQNDPEAAVFYDTAGLTARIENHIRKHPSEWVWMHGRWKTRP